MIEQQKLDLLLKDVKMWNQWREEHPEIQPVLIGANLTKIDLSGTNLSGVNLSMANLAGSNLNSANLSSANLIGANLRGATLSSASLIKADLIQANLTQAEFTLADLTQANLSGADLTQAELIGTNLKQADLGLANLSEANLSEANLSEANLSEATVGWTLFINVNLSLVEGLDRVQHRGPSTISIATVYLSQYNIPDVFLKGAGVPSTFINHLHSFVGQQVDYCNCFINYSLADHIFARQLFTDLQNDGIHCWLVSENTKISNNISTRINETIRVHNSKLLLVLSKHSLATNWVEKEVKSALAAEQFVKRHVLFLIGLDETAKQNENDWLASIRSTHHINDFEHWMQKNDYQQALHLLVNELKANN